MKMQIYLLIFLMLFVTGCATTYYGVSEEIWLEMNDNQKQIAIAGYNQRELLRTKHRIEQEKARDQRIAEEEKIQFEKTKRIYNGEGQVGDLIQLSILSGEIKLGFKNRSIEPISVRLANGETRKIKIKTIGHKYINFTAQLSVKYKDGLVMIGSDQSGHGGIRIPYEHQWLRGKEYTGMSGRGSYKMNSMNIKVIIIPQGKTPAIIIYQPDM